jgi:hypothetical protein
MRRPLLFATLAAATMAIAGGCTDATGSVQGGEALTSSGTSDGGGGTTWTSLYADFFGPGGKASCSSQTTCHGDPSQSGTQISGFLCGTTKDSCWHGLTNSLGTDAGGFGLPAILPTGSTDAGPVDPTKTPFYLALHQATSGDNSLCSQESANIAFDCNMPCGDPVTCHEQTSPFLFMTDDLARIATWIQQGAQDN